MGGGWIDGWIDGWMDGWMGGCVYVTRRPSPSRRSVK